MNAAMEQLLQTDQEARQIVEQARAYSEEIRKSIRSRKEALEAEYEERARRHIEDAKRAGALEAEEAIALQHQRHERVLSQLEQRFAACREELADELVRRCLRNE